MYRTYTVRTTEDSRAVEIQKAVFVGHEKNLGIIMEHIGAPLENMENFEV